VDAWLACVSGQEKFWCPVRVLNFHLYQKHYEDLEAALSDPALTDNVRLRYIREADALLHRVSELMGWLPSRTQVQLDLGGVELPPLGTKWVR
jgi:hypothetical protein